MFGEFLSEKTKLSVEEGRTGGSKEISSDSNNSTNTTKEVRNLQNQWGGTIEPGKRRRSPRNSNKKQSVIDISGSPDNSSSPNTGK